MEKIQKFKSVRIYDKSNNLVNYIEFSDDQELKCFYSVNGSILSKKYLNDYQAEDPPFTEMVSSVIQFDDNIMLFPDPTRAETSLKAISSGETFTSFSPPPMLSSVVTYEDNETDNTSIETFTVNSNLIDEWVNKL